MSRTKHRNRVSMIPDVSSRHSYVDSIALRMPRLLPKDAFRDLRIALARQRSNKVRTVVRKINYPPPSTAFHLVFWVHQPTVEAIEILKRHGRGMLYSVHVALDLEPAGETQARELQDYIAHRMQKNGRPVRKSHRVRDTVYLGGGQVVYRTPTGSVTTPSRRGSEIAIYSDKVSKVTLAPCAHVEYRTTGASWLERAGLATLDDVLSLDHYEFWRKRIQLKLPPPRRRLQELVAERVGRWQKKANKKAVDSRIDRLRLATDYIDGEFDRLGLKDHPLIGTDLLFFCRETELLNSRLPKNLFRDEDSFWMLPQSAINALWNHHMYVGRKRIKVLEESYLMPAIRRPRSYA